MKEDYEGSGIRGPRLQRGGKREKWLLSSLCNGGALQWDGDVVMW